MRKAEKGENSTDDDKEEGEEERGAGHGQAHSARTAACPTADGPPAARPTGKAIRKADDGAMC